MTNKTVQVYEYDQVSFDHDENDERHLNKIDLSNLLLIENALPKRVFELQGSDSVRFRQYVGNIFLPNGTAIEILPKVNRDISEGNQAVCRGSLMYMLANVFNLTMSSSTSGLSDLENTPFQDLIIRHFCFKLEEEIHRGIIRIYVSEQDNLTTLKGRLKFTEHIRHNFANKARFYCEYDEFSENNTYNQQLKAMLKVFYNRVWSDAVKQQLINLEFILSDVADVATDIGQLDRLSFNRLNERFEDIFTLGKIILKGFSPNMSTGDTLAPAMLFDMNKLFEEFVANKLRDSFQEKNQKDFEVRTQDKSKQLGIKYFLLQPDIVVKYQGQTIGVLDTKWKSLKQTDNAKISTSDVYQMYAYAQRFKCKYNALLYPSNNNNQSQKLDSLYLDETGNIENSVDLHIKFFNLNFIKENEEANIRYEESEFKKQISALTDELKYLKCG